MNRKELMNEKCWSCWWREGGKCYSEELGELKKEGIMIIGHEINKELINKCAIERKNFLSKREMFARNGLEGDRLIIASELAKEGEDK